jgi:signal peptidase II
LPRFARLSRHTHAILVQNIVLALGNAVDRVRIGAVVDYLDFYWRTWHWPAFNLADIWVVSAAMLLMLSTFQQSPVSIPQKIKSSQ